MEKEKMIVYWIIIIISISYLLISGGNTSMKLDTGVTALIVAIIGLIGSIIGNVIVNLRGWKSSEKMIGSSSSNKTLTAMLGNDGADRVSLSDEHKQIENEISTAKEAIKSADNNLALQFKEFKEKTERLILPNKELLIRIDEREKSAEKTRKMREELLTPTQMAIKNSIDNLTAMSDNWQKLNADLANCKDELYQLKLNLIEKDNLIKQQEKEISILKRDLSNAKQQISSPDIPPNVKSQKPMYPFMEEEEEGDEWDLEL